MMAVHEDCRTYPGKYSETPGRARGKSTIGDDTATRKSRFQNGGKT